MRISTKGIYALEIVADLAMHSTEDSWESLKNIANRRNLSEKYLERIMKGLKDNGVVVSVRGAYGGYCLAKNAEEITAYDVLAALEMLEMMKGMPVPKVTELDPEIVNRNSVRLRDGF